MTSTPCQAPRPVLAHPDRRVTPLTPDVTSAAQIQAAAVRAGPLDVLISNAGIALYDDLSDRAALNATPGFGDRDDRAVEVVPVLQVRKLSEYTGAERQEPHDHRARHATGFRYHGA